MWLIERLINFSLVVYDSGAFITEIFELVLFHPSMINRPGKVLFDLTNQITELKRMVDTMVVQFPVGSMLSC